MQKKCEFGKQTLRTVMFDYTNEHFVFAAGDGNAYRVRLSDYSIMLTYETGGGALNAYPSETGKYLAVATGRWGENF